MSHLKSKIYSGKKLLYKSLRQQAGDEQHSCQETKPLPIRFVHSCNHLAGCFGNHGLDGCDDRWFVVHLRELYCHGPFSCTYGSTSLIRCVSVCVCDSACICRAHHRIPAQWSWLGDNKSALRAIESGDGSPTMVPRSEPYGF